MKKKPTKKESSSSSGDDFNAMLTTEGMLQVEDVRSGKTSDVRKMLGIKSEDIKNEKLKDHLKGFNIATSQPLNPNDEVVEEIVDGAYFEQLNTLNNALAFDMGTVGPGVQEEEEKKVEKHETKKIDNTAWDEWWATK